MKRYVFKRVLQAIPMLLAISIVSFLIMNLAPGDPSRTFIGPKMNKIQVAETRERLGFNKPITVRYAKWIKTVIKGDFGYSFISHQPVSEEIGARVPVTLGLMGITMLISIIISIPLGMICAFKRNKSFDNVVTAVCYVGISIPGFWFAMMLIVLFSVKLSILPSIGMRAIGIETNIDLIKHSIMPCMVLSFPNIAVLTRYIRSSAISQLKEDYVITAISKGASRNRILFSHVLKNSMIPFVTILGMSLPELISGSFITESIFGWPGMGRFGVTSVFNRDYPAIMAITMITSILLILGNLISDILYATLDPRIKVVDKHE
ncbi:ABC transporter permease [Clostridium tagluense]|uniref:ABC transporter permease n=1 Tax=Clostridium tagluense TaxID=360422 RepID=UPI001C0B6304|nr:ABC transporter permease [Clostridium tagluense]MBU3126318.1 ABC transporter permease [Clostridium tagluense]MCB2309685.1 ABC transporter permease [Clostridium tagluense]MCB2314785.1 ABC transporter permease [Clostridium tagluense]MCB2319634.1 ABC transporter permease [Clostridium tagluense]MCB2324279.1 ABC transporter permease [Clostridium tagluense]